MIGISSCKVGCGGGALYVVQSALIFLNVLGKFLPILIEFQTYEEMFEYIAKADKLLREKN